MIIGSTTFCLCSLYKQRGISLKKSKLISEMLVFVLVICLCSCAQNQDEVTRTFNDGNKYNSEKIVTIDHGSLDESNDIRAWIYATSETSYEQEQSGKNIVLRNTKEPIFFSVHQTGRDRKMRLLVYMDYEGREFSIGKDNKNVNFYDIEIKNNEEIVLPIYIDFSNIDVDESHRIIFLLIPGYDQYAKDKEDITYNPAISTMYQLFFKEYTTNVRCAGKAQEEMATEMAYYDERDINILLNTDGQDAEMLFAEGMRLPEKHYLINCGDAMDMKCWISNTSVPEKYALVFLTVGNLPAQINGKDFLIFDLNNNKMGEKEIEISFPNDTGIYDTIGYVVYNPFDLMVNGESGFVYSSPRFSVEVMESDIPA